MAILKNIQDYHERTKHHLDRYARSLGYMDWKNQPNSFRFYAGGKALHLQLTKDKAGHANSIFFNKPSIAPKVTKEAGLRPFDENSEIE